jgi:hypothetical protein
MKLIETYIEVNNQSKYTELLEVFERYKKVIGFGKYKHKLGPDNQDAIVSDLINYIEKAGVKSITFEPLRGALGMAHYDRMILSNTLITGPFCHLLYVILHETSHYYQFKKHGPDIEWGAFNKESDDDTINEILDIEITADRLALRKFNEMKKKYNYNCSEPVLFYDKVRDNQQHYNQIKSYVAKIKREIKSKNITNNNDMVDLIYNIVK